MKSVNNAHLQNAFYLKTEIFEINKFPDFEDFQFLKYESAG